MGVGAAMTGLRPIVEGMNMGFLLLAFSQISNNAGMLHYTSGGNYTCPMVIRGPGGASCCCAVTSQHVPILHPIHTGVGRQLGAEHSQRLESYFQAIPGMALGSRKSFYPIVFCKGGFGPAGATPALLHPQVCSWWLAAPPRMPRRC